jgi:hypothetical protein
VTSRRPGSNRLSPHYKYGAGPDLLRRQEGAELDSEQ